MKGFYAVVRCTKFQGQVATYQFAAGPFEALDVAEQHIRNLRRQNNFTTGSSPKVEYVHFHIVMGIT